MSLTPSQTKAVEHSEGNCRVTATAGSGKTTALVTRCQRIAKVPGTRQLCLSFTKAAAKNMQERAQVTNNVIYRTFHGMCFNFIKAHTKMLTGSQKLLTPKESWMLDQWAEKVASVVELNAKEVAAAFSIAQSSGVMPEEWSKGVFGLTEEEAFSASMLHKKVLANGKWTFGDLQIEMLRALRTNDKERANINEMLTHIMVDEFQDTDLIQTKILQTISNDNLFAVGDPDQSLYSWRGADPEIMQNFGKYFGDFSDIVLETNFRSQQCIVALADTLINSGQDTSAYAVRAHRAAATPVQANVFASEGDESSWVASDIKTKILSGVSPRDIAILYRTNAYAGVFEVDLVGRGIPYQNSDQSEGFFGMNEVKTLLSYLKLAVNPADLTALRHVWNRPNRFLANKMLADAVSHDCKDVFSVCDYLIKKPSTKKQVVARLQELKAVCNATRANLSQSPAALLRSLVANLKYRHYLHELAARPGGRTYQAQVDAVQKLVNTIAVKSKTASTLLAYIERTIAENQAKEETPDAVTLSTVHKAKGLEYPHVYVVGFSEGVLPHANAKSIEEERRIAFVAMTRAEDFLTLTCADKPSRFLQEMNLTPTQYDPTNNTDNNQ